MTNCGLSPKNRLCSRAIYNSPQTLGFWVLGFGFWGLVFWGASAEIAAGGRGLVRGEARVPELVDDEVGDVVGGALDAAGDAEEGGGAGDGFVDFVDFGPDDEVYEAGFVFEGHEEDAGGGLGALAADDEAGVVDEGLVG